MFVTTFVFNSLKTASRRLLDAADDGLRAAGGVRRLLDLLSRNSSPRGCAAPASGFCYNTVRYLAAPAPILLGYLSTLLSFRTAAVVMSSVYLVGMVALIWAPETKGQAAAGVEKTSFFSAQFANAARQTLAFRQGHLHRRSHQLLEESTASLRLTGSRSARAAAR